MLTSFFYQLPNLARLRFALNYSAVAMKCWAGTEGFLSYDGQGARVSKDCPGQ
jgi:hypothetical protein